MESKRCTSGGVLWWRLVVAAALFLFFVASVNAQTSNPDRHGHHGHQHPLPPMRRPNSPVQLHVSDQQVVMENGNIEVTFNYPQGDVIGIRHPGMDNLLDPRLKQTDRGYLDIMWNAPGKIKGTYDRVDGTKFQIITQLDHTVEISFIRTWDDQTNSWFAPLTIDKRYIMRRNTAGIYCYSVFEHPKGWPGLDLSLVRVVYKLDAQKFHFMALSDDKQRVMPMEEDRKYGQRLDYEEAKVLINPSNPELKGEVDDKYQYSRETNETKVHGWISDQNNVGFWMITPSDEYHMAGPLKQELTNHVGPVALNAFSSKHYAGKDINTFIAQDEEWKMVYGPYMIYVNSVAPSSGHQFSRSQLWKDAKRQMEYETQSWPYEFVRSNDYPESMKRGTVTGRLLVRDRYANMTDMPGAYAYVGLAAPGEVGSWQTEGKSYQFWTRADGDGNFMIKNIRPGVYDLYAWVPGFIGDYKYETNIWIEQGSKIELDTIVFWPPRNGPTIWEIGVPDRKAGEFYIPDPSPTLVNKLYINSTSDRFRQYGLWFRYAEIYPDGDPTFTIGKSDYTKDWFFAHVTRDAGHHVYTPTTRIISFELQQVYPRTTYRLYIAVAASHYALIQVRFNDPYRARPHFSTTTAGWDNAIARHGIHGLYRLYSFDVPWYYLQLGTNILTLTQPRVASQFSGLMYDYIRFEGPPLW